jgi:MFS family permease
MIYIWIQCAIVTIAVINLFIHTVDKPLTPPSVSASQPEPVFDFKTEYRALITNKNYLLLVVSFGATYANSGALAAIISALTRPYGYRIRDNAIFGSAYILSGIPGAVIGGLLTDRYRRFKFSITVVCVLVSLLTMMTFITLPTGSVALLAFNLGLIGFAGVPITPLSLAFAVELTYPTPEAMSNGMMLLPSKIYGAIMGLITAALCELDPLFAIAIFTLNTIVGAIASLFIKEDLRRLKLDL